MHVIVYRVFRTIQHEAIHLRIHNLRYRSTK